jgi:hypothetical protein
MNAKYLRRLPDEGGLYLLPRHTRLERFGASQQASR